MKVCTDACILGAWFASKLSQNATVLDIGSGTGLLMLMIAQKSQSSIHGIEIDASSFKQLQENVSGCAWNERLTVFPGDVRSYSFPVKYDFIISNPPFFENDLASQLEKQNLAKHSTELMLVELIAVINKHLSPMGTFGILLPHHRSESFIAMCEKSNFHLLEKLSIRHSSRHDFTRAVMHFGRQKQQPIGLAEMNIHRDKAAGYTEEFIELLRDYYLYL
jgi:tRNA1Val (adenine37-N6)-methyltransferase